MTTTPSLVRPVLEGLAELLPPVVHLMFPAYQGCILYTRLGLEVCSYFGIDARPQPVRVVAYNAAYSAHVARGEDPDVARWAAEDGSHSVGIGFGAPPRPDGWDGHLILIAGDLFADFTIPQASRPSRGIHIPAAIIGAHGGVDSWHMEGPDGTVVAYHHTQDSFYLTAADWRDPVRRRLLSGPVIRELTRRLRP